jgi:hypothetical protein
MPSKNLGVDLGTSGGDWLFRQGELVLGPVPASQIVEKLYSGDLDARSEVSRMGAGQFRRIGEVDFFKVHLAKAQAKQRVDTLATMEAQRSRTGRNVRIGLVATIALIFAVGTAAAARYLAIHKPWKDADELAYADLISVEPPTISRAKVHAEDEELIDYPGSTPGKPPSSGSKIPPSGIKPPPSGNKPPAGTKPGKLNGAGDEPDGLQMAKFDQEAINSVVASRQKTLFPCLVAEAQKKPGLAAKIPIEFVIGNDGRVNKVWVDHPAFKEGTLPECLLRELQKWPFKSYEGERATVGLSFKIGKSG